ncbi:MAG: carboxypeptidase regulatory-like domain-containing protein [Balneolaceae bacterium]|nr:MAG: carboxypeptidase regulatory-like domain-containing protein [Balneolaceae bacterium]
MKNIILLVSMIIVLLGCSSPSGPNGGAIDDTYVVGGRITDAAGTGIPDVLISFTGEFGSTRTDAEGYWEKTGLSGMVVARPQKFGYTFDPATITFTSTNPNSGFLAIAEDSNIKLYDNVIILQANDRANIESFSEQTGILIFSEQSSLTESFSIGDVIIAESSETIPYGLIHKIAEISNDGLTLTLEDATLEDVIEDGEIEISYSISFEEFVDGLELSKGVEIKKIDFGEQKIKFEREFDGDRGKIAGHIQLKSNIDIDKQFRYRLRLQQLKIVYTAEIELDVNYEAKREYERKEIYDLFTLRGPPIIVFTGVTVNPRLVFRAGAEAKIEGGMESGLNWSRKYVAGLEYSRDTGFSTIQNSDGAGWTVKPVKLTGSANALGFAGVAFEGLVWGSAGFGVGVMGYTLAEGKVELSSSDWAWEYDFSLGVKIVSQAKLEIARIAKLTYDGPEYDIFRLPVAYAASGKVIEKIETDGKTEEVGVKDVAIRFDGASVTSGDLADKSTNEKGNWYQDLMHGEVIVKAEKDGYMITPDSIKIDKKGSNYNFTAEPIDLTGIWNGTLTMRSAEGFSSNGDNDDGCSFIDVEDLIGLPIDIILELDKHDNEQKYDARLIIPDIDDDDDFFIVNKKIADEIKDRYPTIKKDFSEEDSIKMVGEFSNGILTLNGNMEGVKIQFVGNFSITESKKFRLSGDFSMDGGSQGKVLGDWGVTRAD